MKVLLFISGRLISDLLLLSSSIDNFKFSFLINVFQRGNQEVLGLMASEAHGLTSSVTWVEARPIYYWLSYNILSVLTYFFSSFLSYSSGLCGEKMRPSAVRMAQTFGIVYANSSSSNSYSRIRLKSRFGDMFNRSKILPLFFVSPLIQRSHLISF